MFLVNLFLNDFDKSCLHLCETNTISHFIVSHLDHTEHVAFCFLFILRKSGLRHADKQP